MNKILLLVALLSGLSLLSQNENCNCCTSQYEAFDFWVGEWIVISPDGNKVGENTIVKLQGNCLLVEHWISTNGKSTGTSQNFYNPKTKQWEQLWIDNQGGHLKLKGKRIGNKMVMTTEAEVNNEGKVFFHRITWTANDDGTVRQVWETIVDNENTTMVFDGLYQKK